jgi:aldose 1-epimerase
MLYHCTWAEKEGESILQLRDDEMDARVDIVTTFGMNVIGWVSQGKEVILQPPSLSTLRKAPFRYGIPVLSPPGRTSWGKFTYRENDYQLPITVGKHNMHGEIGTVPWKVMEWGADAENGAYVQAVYAYRRDPERYTYFPFDMEVAVTYRLKKGSLTLEGTVRNKGEEYAPFSLGYHPYFVCDRNQTVLQIPAHAEWFMDQEGRASTLPEAGGLTHLLREGINIVDVEGNLHYFQCREFDTNSSLKRNDSYFCRLDDKGSDRRIHYQVDGLFAVMVLFIPPWGDAVSLEPHTCIPDAYNLPWEASQSGKLELAPGEQKQFGWRIDVENGASARGGNET